MTKTYAAFFMGQGGYLFSLGIPRLASRAAALGIETDVYRYVDVTPAAEKIAAQRKAGCRIALVGYSLGNTTTTWLQTTMPVDLLLAIAESSLGQNHPIDKRNTKRSVLWSAPGILSDAGLKDGFDTIHHIDAPHLWMDFDESVVAGVLDELTRLNQGDST